MNTSIEDLKSSAALVASTFERMVHAQNGHKVEAFTKWRESFRKSISEQTEESKLDAEEKLRALIQ